MECQKIINLLDNISNQPGKFREKSWVEKNDAAHGTYSTNIQIKFKTSILKSSLCDYSDVYIIVSQPIIVPNTRAAADSNNRENIIIKNCAPFTDWYFAYNTQIDNAKDIDVIIPMYTLIEYSDTVSELSGNNDNTIVILKRWKNASGSVAGFPADDNNSA